MVDRSDAGLRKAAAAGAPFAVFRLGERLAVDHCDSGVLPDGIMERHFLAHEPLF